MDTDITVESFSKSLGFFDRLNIPVRVIGRGSNLLICDGGTYWRKFFKWLFIYKFIKSKKDGETLKKEGWDPGKEMGKEIKRLRYLEIDKLNRN